MGKTRKNNKNYKGNDFPKMKRPQKSKKDRHKQIHPYQRYGPQYYDDDINEGEFSQFFDDDEDET